MQKSIQDLRQEWSLLWGTTPHRRIGRKMLERSIAFKHQEKHIEPRTKRRLNRLVQNYKRNPQYFDKHQATLKTGMQITKNWKGLNHTVTVQDDGFQYQEILYPSLSKVAFVITGTKWNGWRFFNLQKPKVQA